MAQSSNSLLREVWSSEIKHILTKNNNLTNGMSNDSAFILNGYVNLPQGWNAPSTVRKNRSLGALPTTSTNRVDTISQYALNVFSSDSKFISELETTSLSYDKIASIIEQDNINLVNSFYDDIVYSIASNIPASRTILTTGTGTTALNAFSSGNRKAFTLKDISRAAALMDYDRIPPGGRKLLVSPAMAYDLKNSGLLTIIGGTMYDGGKFGSGVNDSGSIGNLFGFEVIERSTTVLAQVYSGSTFVQSYEWNSEVSGTTLSGATAPVVASTNVCECAIAYHPSFTRFATGEYNIFTLVDPDVYGTKLSMMIKGGATTSYSDGRGLILIAQDLA